MESHAPAQCHHQSSELQIPRWLPGVGCLAWACLVWAAFSEPPMWGETFMAALSSECTVTHSQVPRHF